MAAAGGSVILREGEPLPFSSTLGALRNALSDGELPRLRDLAMALGATPLDPRIVSGSTRSALHSQISILPRILKHQAHAERGIIGSQ